MRLQAPFDADNNSRVKQVNKSMRVKCGMFEHRNCCLVKFKEPNRALKCCEMFSERQPNSKFSLIDRKVSPK